MAESQHTADKTDKSPIVVDLGKKRSKSVKLLRKGKGKLMEAIGHSIQELQATGTLSADSQPVIVVVSERKKKRRLFSCL